MSNNNNFKWYLILNNDTILNKDTISLLMKNIKLYKNDNIFSPKIINLNNNNIWYAGAKINKLTLDAYHIGINSQEKSICYKSGYTDYASGCCMLVKKNIVEKLNGFNTAYKMYYEDIDFCIRAKKININSIFIEESSISHHISYSLGGRFTILKSYNKLLSFIKFIYLNNRFDKFLCYLIINIIYSPIKILRILFFKLKG